MAENWTSEPKNIGDCFLSNLGKIEKALGESELDSMDILSAAILTVADAMNGVGFALMNIDHPLSNETLIDRWTDSLAQSLRK